MTEGKKNLWERLADCKPLVVVGSVCSVAGLPLSVMSSAGVQMPAFLDAVGRASFVWLPVLTLATGFLIGWNARERKIADDGITAERIEKLEDERDELAGQLGAITDSVTEEFMGQVPFLKLMAMDAYDRDGIDDPHDFLFDQICDDDLLRVACDLFLQDSLVPEGTRWVLRPEVRASIDEKPELLDSARRARERGEEGDYAMFTVLDGAVARDEKMYKERMGFVV